ncbi:MAG TPA: TRAP transporter TatT component family protein [Pyrinomonadaceae bacterium]|nr:TRAP transporter TatT component family protein [Pyrinomonadaceae bacterium]
MRISHISLAKLGICTFLFCLFAVALSCRKDEKGPGIDGGDEALAQEKIVEADQLYLERQDLNKTRMGVALLRQGRVADYGNYEAAWKLSRFLYHLGTYSEDVREREAAFREGTEVGKVAVELNGQSAEGHFWLGANYGGAARDSALASLANVEEIRKEMEAVLAIDHTYERGSAYMVLGQLYLEAPRLLGGDTQKAIEYLEKGLQVGGDNPLLRLRLAQAYRGDRRNAEARRQIDFILKMKPDPNYLPEYEDAVREAKKLLERIR